MGFFHLSNSLYPAAPHMDAEHFWNCFFISEMQNPEVTNVFQFFFHQSYHLQQKWTQSIASESSGPPEVAAVPHSGTDKSSRARHYKPVENFNLQKLEQTKDVAVLLQEKNCKQLNPKSRKTDSKRETKSNKTVWASVIFKL